MSIGLFTDKQHEPTRTEIDEAVGTRLPLWHELSQFIREKYAPTEDFKFLYGKNYGWGLRFRIKGQLLTNLYPSTGGFTVQIILNPEAVEAIRIMKTGKNVRQAIENAKPYPEGRWLFIPVETMEDISDIHRLLELRMNRHQKQKD